MGRGAASEAKLACSLVRPRMKADEPETRMGQAQQDFDGLTVEEQIQHVQDLWERIAARPERVPLTGAQRTELRRRLEEHRRDPNSGESWEVVRDRLLNKT